MELNRIMSNFIIRWTINCLVCAVFSLNSCQAHNGNACNTCQWFHLFPVRTLKMINVILSCKCSGCQRQRVNKVKVVVLMLFVWAVVFVFYLNLYLCLGGRCSTFRFFLDCLFYLFSDPILKNL